MRNLNTEPVAEDHLLPKKKAFASPIRIFVDKDRVAFLWFCVAVVAALFAIGEPIYLLRQFQRREPVLVVDPAGNYYISPLLDFQKAKELHAQQSTIATTAFLERNPNGFDDPELLKRLFLKDAVKKAFRELGSEAAEFKAKQLHQKAEIARIDILQTRENFVMTQVTGQLVRTGIFEGKVFSESIPFKLSFKWLRNPDMAHNGRFPTAVTDFKYEQNP